MTLTLFHIKSEPSKDGSVSWTKSLLLDYLSYRYDAWIVYRIYPYIIEKLQHETYSNSL